MPVSQSLPFRFCLKSILIALVAVVFLSMVRIFFSLLLFHSFVELFTVTIGLLMLVIVWNTRHFTNNDFLVYLGVGYFGISILDLLHTLTFQGMPFFQNLSIDVTVHFWVFTRLLEALLLLSSLIFLRKKINLKITFSLVGFIVVLVSWASFNTIGPQMISSEGLTTAKISSEYIIVAILISAIIFFYKSKKFIEPTLFRLLILAIILTIIAELAFTLYANFLGLSFVIGHVFKLLSFLLIYQAIVQNTLKEPFRSLAKTSRSYDAIPHPAIVIDNAVMVSQVNQAAEQFIGKDASDILHKEAHGLFHPSDIGKERCEFCESTRRGRPIDNKLTWYPQVNRWYLVSLSVIKTAEEAVGMVQSLTDVSVQINARTALEREMSERKLSDLALYESEQRFREMTQSASSTIISINVANRIVFVNQAVTKNFGFNVDELLGKPLSILIPLRFQNLHQAGIENFAKSKKRTLDWSAVEAVAINKQGEEVAIEISISSYTQKGELFFLGIIRDNSEQIKAKERLESRVKERTLELERSKEEAEIANRIKGEFLAHMSHDLKTPLNAILGYAQILKKNIKNQDMLEKGLEVIHHSGDNLLSLINDILDFSKSQAGKIELKMALISFDRFIDNINQQVKVLASQKNLNFDYIGSESLPTVIMADEKRLREVLFNLLENAIKYTDKGGVIFKVSSYKKENFLNQIEIVFQVIDTGVGIAADKIEKIFSPFFRDEEMHSAQPGQGLGLAITKSLIELMGTEIKVTSELNKGSEFSFKLELITGEKLANKKLNKKGEVKGLSKKTKLILPEIYKNEIIKMASLGNITELDRILKKVAMQKKKFLPAIKKLRALYDEFLFDEIITMVEAEEIIWHEE